MRIQVEESGIIEKKTLLTATAKKIFFSILPDAHDRRKSLNWTELVTISQTPSSLQISLFPQKSDRVTVIELAFGGLGRDALIWFELCCWPFLLLSRGNDVYVTK